MQRQRTQKEDSKKEDDEKKLSQKRLPLTSTVATAGYHFMNQLS